MKNATTTSFAENTQVIGKMIGFLALTALAIKLAVVCFTSFNWLGALFVFVLGVFALALVAAPLIGIAAVAIGAVLASIIAAVEHFNKKRVNRT